MPRVNGGLNLAIVMSSKAYKFIIQVFAYMHGIWHLRGTLPHYQMQAYFTLRVYFLIIFITIKNVEYTFKP